MRIWLTALLLLLPSLAYAVHKPDEISFRVFREGSPMGSHTIKLTQEGDKTIADIAIDLKVAFGPLTLYSYTHRNREVWQKGKLVELRTSTNDNGTQYNVAGKATKKGFIVTGSGGEFIAPNDIMTTSYWQARTMEQDQLLDTQHGKLVSVQSREHSREILHWGKHKLPAKHYQVRGELDLDIWYDDAGNWVKLLFKARGSEIIYQPKVLAHP
jgi:hypothetical protein